MHDLKSISSIEQLEELAEGIDFEAKLAHGKDGLGAVPESIWSTYSAFANTSGGLILLGVEQPPDKSLRVVGLRNAEKVRVDFWSTVNTVGKVSRNLLVDSNVQAITIENRTILAIVVPRATRSERPVHVGTNPLSGTYRRVHEADQKCSPESVKAMLADAIAEDRSARVVQEVALDDLDSETIQRYRSRLEINSVDNPLLDKKESEFLCAIGAAMRDKVAKAIRPTFAGLIMFGKHEAIKERLPHFFLDYRRIENSDPGSRYVDRIVWDGTWSGNVFDFYLLTSPKLFASATKSFALNGEFQRVDNNTQVQVALREALVNALIHADYELSGGIAIIQEADKLEFRNPGLMRISVEQAFEGGVSDCRNAKIQQMFRLVGFAEQIGSGIPQIIAAWDDRSWQIPEIVDEPSPDRTKLTLRMTDFLPPALRDVLRGLGVAYEHLNRVERYALGLALMGISLTNKSLQKVSGYHPRDITVLLGGLVNRGLLARNGRTTAASYTAGESLLSLSGTAEASARDQESAGKSGRPVDASGPVNSDIVGVKSDISAINTEFTEAELLSLPRLQLEPSDVDVMRSARHVSQEIFERAILALCAEGALGIGEIARRLNRTPDRTQNVVRTLVSKGQLTPTMPAKNPKQRYVLNAPVEFLENGDKT